MALKKEIIQRNGIATNYHRILFTQSTINSHNSIVVISYLNEDNRRNATHDTYSTTITYEKPYQENMTVEEAYEYLKTLPEFEGAEDV